VISLSERKHQKSYTDAFKVIQLAIITEYDTMQSGVGNISEAPATSIFRAEE